MYELWVLYKVSMRHYLRRSLDPNLIMLDETVNKFVEKSPIVF